MVLALTCSSANSASQFDALKGSFSVGELGTARFEVKLRLPKSSGSFSPNIGISYESGAADRLMGPSWAVTGLSQITRCPKTIGQHGTIEGIKLNSPGPFCLDGKLLIAVQGDYGKDGTVYRTEHEAFSRIVSFGSLGNGPEWFSVETKSGQILELGRSPGARRALGRPTNVLGWGVEIVSDRSKNFYFVEYESSVSEGWQVPKRVVFSGNRNGPVEPSHVIEFSYGPRGNYTKSFVDGEYSLSKHLLQAINILSDGNRIASYGFSYEPSPITTSERLIRIDHCAVDGDCLAPLQFSWEAQSLELSGPHLVADLPITGGVVDFVACLRDQFFTPWDIRFNGRSDLVCHTPGPQNTLATYVATGDVSSDTGLPTFGEWRRRSDDSQPEFLTDASCAGRILPADVNGDGIPDWVCVRNRTIPIVDAPADQESQVFVQLGRIESGEPATRSVSYSSWTVWSDVFHHPKEPDHRHRRLLRPHRERPRSRRTAEQRDELASFQVIEFHSVPCTARAALQDIELQAISQRASERLYNRLAVDESGRCPNRVLARARHGALDPAGSVSLSRFHLPISDHPKIQSADQLGSVRLGGFHGGRTLLQSTLV
jgi:hypothetical protein